MNRSVEQALISLLPSINSALPEELVSLATSTLAQSRSKASNLKAEEEIARSYVCAHLACEKLKRALNLPRIEPRPPCPPRVYDKLFAHLSTALASKPRGRPPKTPASAQAPTRPSATTATSHNRPIPSTSNSRTRSRQLTIPSSSSTLPPWLMSTIRHLCMMLAAPSAPPHVLAGVSSILTLPPPFLSNIPTSPSSPKKDKIPALIIAVYFFVVTRLRGTETNGGEYTTQRRAAMEALETLNADGAREDFDAKDVDAWLREISERGWLRLDWFGNIVEGSGVDVPVNDDGEADTDEQLRVQPHLPSHARLGREITNPNILQPGLGTMMQDRIDFLSETKRLDFLAWKDEIMARVREAELRQMDKSVD